MLSKGDLNSITYFYLNICEIAIASNTTHNMTLYTGGIGNVNNHLLL